MHTGMRAVRMLIYAIMVYWALQIYRSMLLLVDMGLGLWWMAMILLSKLSLSRSWYPPEPQVRIATYPYDWSTVNYVNFITVASRFSLRMMFQEFTNKLSPYLCSHVFFQGIVLPEGRQSRVLCVVRNRCLDFTLHVNQCLSFTKWMSFILYVIILWYLQDFYFCNIAGFSNFWKIRKIKKKIENDIYVVLKIQNHACIHHLLALLAFKISKVGILFPL